LRRLLRSDDRKLRASSVYIIVDLRRDEESVVSEYNKRVRREKNVSRHPLHKRENERNRETRKKKYKPLTQKNEKKRNIAYLCEEVALLLAEEAKDLTATNGDEAVVTGVAVANIFFFSFFFSCVFCVFFFFFLSDSKRYTLNFLLERR
jgi:hypothetical protein